MVRWVVLLVALTFAGAPAVAHAEAAWVHDSALSEQSTGYLRCAGSDPDDLLAEVLPSVDYAEVFLDQAAPPPLGGVQYVRVQWYATGGDRCVSYGATGAAIELIPPPGTELALSPENPALCGFGRSQDAATCPVIALPGDYGGTLLADGRSGQPTLWPVSDGLNPTRLIVPLRFLGPLQSFGASAERWCNAGPCPPGESNGRAQFAVRFVPGTGGTPSAPITTSVGVSGGAAAAATPAPTPSAPGATPTPSPTATPLLAGKAPKRVRRSALRRGWPLRVKTPTRATARVRLLVGKRVVATVSRRARRASTLTLKLKASAKSLRRLGSRARNAQLVITVGKQRQTLPVRITA